MSLEVVEEQDGAITLLLNERQLLRQQIQLLDESLTSERNLSKRLKILSIVLAIVSAVSVSGWVLFGVTNAR